MNLIQEEAQCPFIVAMIESRLGVENLNDILSVKGLDAVLIGPYDLSASFGLTGQFENAEFQEIMAMIKNKALEGYQCRSTYSPTVN